MSATATEIVTYPAAELATVVRQAELVYVSDDAPGLGRKRSGKGFSYFDESGKRLTDKKVRARLNALAIPPAWTDVWICSQENGHILATGRDEKGRKQYLYHPEWQRVRDTAKFDHMLSFGRLLPRIGCVPEKGELGIV